MPGDQRCFHAFMLEKAEPLRAYVFYFYFSFFFQKSPPPAAGGVHDNSTDRGWVILINSTDP